MARVAAVPRAGQTAAVTAAVVEVELEVGVEQLWLRRREAEGEDGPRFGHRQLFPRLAPAPLR